MLVPSLEEELLEFVVQRVEQNVHIPNQKGLHFVITRLSCDTLDLRKYNKIRGTMGWEINTICDKVKTCWWVHKLTGCITEWCLVIITL